MRLIRPACRRVGPDFYKVNALNISRIILFAIVLLVLRVIVSAVVAGPGAGEELSAQIVLGYLTSYLLDAVVVIAVFTTLARVQARSPYMHALSVVVLQELLGAALSFVIVGAGFSSPLWLIDYVVLAVSVVVGTEIGRRLRVIAEKKQEQVGS